MHEDLKWIRDSWGTGWLLVDKNYQACNSLRDVVIHVCACAKDDIYEHTPTDRYCLFLECDYSKHLGDLPIDMPEEELKAMAIALWRMR